MCSTKHSHGQYSTRKTTMSGLHIVLVILVTIAVSTAENHSVFSGLKMMKKLYDQCENKPDMWKCFKIQALKVADRALQSRSFGLIDGVNVVREASARSFQPASLNHEKLEMLSSGQIDKLILQTITQFLDTHSVQVNVPKLIEEGRGKKNKGYMGPMLALVAIKGTFLAMAYKAIAAMAGTALIIGKIALVLSAVLGLKKLLSSGSEKTTFEIVKIPHHSQSHSYTSSYEDEGHYHRSLNPSEEYPIQQRAYRGYKYASS